MKYSKDEIRKILEEKGLEERLNSSQLQTLSRDLEQILDVRENCIGSEASENFKLGDLVYLTQYGQVGFVVGVVKNAFKELDSYYSTYIKDPSKIKDIKSFLESLPSSAPKFVPRYLVLLLDTGKDEADINKQAFCKGKDVKYPPAHTTLGEKDTETRVRYPKENTMVKILESEFKLTDSPLTFKKDLDSFCKFQCLLSDSCSSDCILHKYKVS